MKQRDSCAASAGVSGGHSRVLLAPMIGALHMMPKAIRLGSGASMIVVNDAPPALPLCRASSMKRARRTQHPVTQPPSCGASVDDANEHQNFLFLCALSTRKEPRGIERECQHAYDKAGDARTNMNFNGSPQRSGVLGSARVWPVKQMREREICPSFRAAKPRSRVGSLASPSPAAESTLPPDGRGDPFELFRRHSTRKI